MREEDIIKNKYGSDSGMRVPEGYFNALNESIMANLPPYQEKPRQIELSKWQRYKPYVYLAAMFCGIWLMMKVFHSVTQPMYIGLDNPPAALVQLMDEYPDEGRQFSYYVPDYEIEEEIAMSYDSFEEFEKDFDSLQP